MRAESFGKTSLSGIKAETPDYSDSVRAMWARDPVRFVSETLGANPWSKQVEILEAIRDHVRVAVRSCNGSGKTYIAAHVVLWWLMCHPDAIVITTAPTDHQVRNILWREIRRAHHENAGAAARESYFVERYVLRCFSQTKRSVEDDSHFGVRHSKSCE